ncbi:MAG: hypothetical protein K2I77_04585 [Anaeroplasmataceae bacterium]|nr:hypothetical protein [Anaeroplasmataceae bacterium]
MNLKQLREVIKKYKLESYINASLRISEFDDRYLSMFNIGKRKLLERIFSKKRKLKYKVFKKIDYSRGVIRHLRYFEDKDAAAEYAWELFKDYVATMTIVLNAEEWVNFQKSLLEIINAVEKEYI